jgi:hypothetical protein
LERLSWQMGLPGVELAPFAGLDDLPGVSYYGGPVEALSKSLAN